MTNILVVPSGYLKDVFNNLGYPSIIIPNTINLDKFNFRKRKKITPKILSARNLTPVYNISCVIRAFKLLRDQYSNATLTIAGDGPEKDELLSLTEKLNLQHSVKFLGNIPNNAMSELYNQADILVNASNIDNMPVSILEAQAMGLVVVSTNPGGIPYIIENGYTGLISEVNNDKKLGENLIEAVRDQDKSKSMITNSKNYVGKVSPGQAD